MAEKFFNKPQLGQANLSQAAQTNETGVDNNANAKAQQANQSVDFLLGMSGQATKIVGSYQKNMDAKHRLESQKEIPFYVQKMQQELAATENYESMGKDALNNKFNEVTSDFMEGYKDKPYSKQLKNDLEGMRGKVLGQMLTKRDAAHVQTVSNATSESASGYAQQFASGALGEDELRGLVGNLMAESTIAHQVPSSTELELPEESREKYMQLTRQQSRDAILKGLMVQTGQPNNSKVATILADQGFRDLMEIDDSDEDYNKMVGIAFKKGTQADKLVYKQGVDRLKEGLYSQTNQGMTINIDEKIGQFRAKGGDITAQDEHKLRKAFKTENDLVVSSAKYIQNLEGGRDVTAGMTKKDRESVYDRSLNDVLNLTGEDLIGINDINGALINAPEQHAFGDYLKSGGKIPDKVKKMFDVPAGSSVDKWEQANNTLMSMEAAALGSGQSVESIIGVKEVSKVRGMARILADETMDEATKRNAIDAFNTRSTTFNTKGYLQGTAETKVDTDWLTKVSRDANWTTDDYVSDQQNADEIAGNYQAYRLAGMSEDGAQDAAMTLFKQSNTNFEMPNGGEIVIPKDHIYLNNESIIAFSKDASRFPSMREQREDIELLTGQGWISEWRANSNVSIQKSYNFAKTGKYDMMFDGRLVRDSSFTYEEMQDFIAGSSHEVRTKITGVKTERPFSVVEQEALENRTKKIKKRVDSGQYIDYLNDLTL